MRRKKLISLKNPAQDAIEYRFKPLFLAYLFYTIAVTVSGDFIFGIFAVISIKSINEAVLTFIGFSLGLLIAEILGVWFILKNSDIVMTLENISAVDYWYRRKYIGWQEITLLKQRQLFGIRYLSIKTASGKSVVIPPRYYNSSEILDRVRELAGSEHILVRALEKELSRPRYELTKIWCWVIGTIALTMSIYLIGGNMYAAEQEKPLEQAIASYVRQHPKTVPNQSAIELQSLMTKLGLSVNIFGDGSKVKVIPTTAAIDEWSSIQTPLATFINERLDKTEDSIEPIPNKLATYIKNHQADLDAIETHLVTNPIPKWGNDAWIAQREPQAENSPLLSQLMNTFSLAHLQNLTILDLLDKQQRPNADLSINLVTLEKLQQSIRSQQSLMGQLISIIGQSRISKLVRQIDSPQAQLNGRVPQGWGNNLFDRKSREYMRGAIEYESLTANKFLLSSSLFDRLLVTYESPLRFIPGLSTLIRPHLRLTAVDRHREVTKGLTYWSQQNICRKTGESGIKSDFNFDNYSIEPMLLTSQYAKILKQELLWELTTSIRAFKAKLAAGQKIDLIAKDFQLQSQVCPGEQWTAKATDGSVQIAFSHPPNWKDLGISSSTKSESLTYTIKSAKTQPQ